MGEEGVSKDVIAKMIETNNQSMMKSMEQLFQKSIDELKRSHVNSSDAQIREIKKLKMEEPRRFKKKANEDQFRFNAKIQDTLEETTGQPHKRMPWTKLRTRSRKVRTY